MCIRDRRKIVLEKHEYVRLLDATSGQQRLIKGPAKVVPEPFESMVDGDEPSKATKLSKRQYVRVTETLTGAQRVVSGPTLHFLGPYDEHVGTHDKIVLLNHQYARLVDQATGDVRVEKGEQTIVPGPYEHIVEQTDAVHVDDETAVCLGCHAPFDGWNWRHHCRKCGGIFCDACSPYKCLIHPADVVYPPDWDSLLSTFDPREPLRTCAACREALLPYQDDLRKTCSNASQTTEVDRADVARYLNVPLQFDMRSEIQKATHTLLNFCADNALEGASDQVPADLIASAWGLAFLTTMQAGFFFSARVGSGLVIARTRDGGWSAPSAVCTAGAGWGLQIGGEVTDMLVVLNLSLIHI